MTRSALLISIGTSALFFAAAFPVFAESSVSVSNNGEGSRTSVKVKTNTGGNTICQNGKCTTTDNSSNGTNTVCYNGDCHTTTDGNVNYQSDDGNTKVNINNTSDSTTAVESDIVEKQGVVPTISPADFKDVKGIHTEANAKKSRSQKESPGAAGSPASSEACRCKVF